MRVRFAVLLLQLAACVPGPTEAPPTVPGPPTEVTATRAGREVKVSWLAPDDGGSPLLVYTVTSSPPGAVIVTPSTSALIGGLVNGSYTFSVTASNKVGSGAASLPSNAVTLASVPDAPASVIAMAGNAKATVSWTQPANDGGSALTGYLVRFATGEVAAMTRGATQVLVSGLVNGTSHAFTVTAINDEGSSAPSGFSNTVMPLAVPAEPTAVIATAGSSSAAVRWSPPVDEGGSSISLYTVTAEPGGSSATTTGATTATVNGLINGTAYVFTVTAHNAVGRGLVSEPSSAVTPATVPGAPLDVIATSGNQVALVSWTAPSDDGGAAITEYTVTSIPGGLTVTSRSLSATVMGLTNGLAYTFAVRARNWAGTGARSLPSASITPLGVPSAPVDVEAIRGNASATVSWSAPADTGGTPITSWLVTPSPGAGSVTVPSGASHTTTITGLTKGTAYTFTVNAVNVIGAGGASDPSNSVIPSTVPGAPSAVVATADDQQAVVRWQAADGNGAPVTRYTVTSSPGGFTASTSGTTEATFTGLTNGTAYTFTVVAQNLVGAGPASAPSNVAIPSAIPGAPINVIAVAGNQQATLTWVAAPNNGSPVTQYLVSSNPNAGVFSATGTSLTFTGLTNGTAYTFTVTAVNTKGSSPASAPSNSVTPATVPTAPTGVVAIGATGSATLSWSAPASDGSSAITGYLISSVPSGVTFTVGAVTQATVSGLIWSSSYAFTVTAINAIGRGPASVPSNVVALFSAVCGGTMVMAGQLPLLATNGNSTSVRLADLDGDGALDLLVADTSVDVLTVHQGNGNGSFQAARTFPIASGNGAGVRFIAVTDLNGDARLDVAVTNVTSASVSVLLGNATSLLSPRIDSSLTAGISLAAGDFDGDGQIDLAAGVSNGSVVTMRGSGTGAFAQGVPIGVSGRWVTTGDFDGDGRLDLAIATGSSVRVLLGSGSGAFQAATTVAVANAGFLSSLDLNRDGSLDLAVITNASITVLLGQGNGTFGSPTFYPTATGGGSILGSFVARDLNADGHLDLVTANATTASVLLGTGTGTLGAASTFTTGTETRAGDLGDLTGDGRLDFVVVNAAVVRLFAGRGDGSFTSSVPAASLSTGLAPIYLSSGDFNADGRLDLVAANFGSRTVTLSLGNGDGTFSPRTSFPTPDDVMAVLSTDLDADGKLDLLSTNRGDNSVSFFRGTGVGGFQAPIRVVTGSGPSHAAIADFNGDGLPDVATANYYGSSVSILRGNGTGGLQPALTMQVFGGPHALVARDFDLDGKQDLAMALFNGNQVGLLLGNGDGTFRTQANFPAGASPRSLVAGDFDSDGKLDIAVANHGSTAVSVLRGNGDGTFQAQTLLPLRSAQGSIFSIDVDGDGTLDLLATNTDGRLTLLRGRGDATFLPPVSWAVGADPFGGIASDFNGDGAADFAVANYGSNDVTVLLRTGCLP